MLRLRNGCRITPSQSLTTKQKPTCRFRGGEREAQGHADCYHSIRLTFHDSCFRARYRRKDLRITATMINLHVLEGAQGDLRAGVAAGFRGSGAWARRRSRHALQPCGRMRCGSTWPCDCVTGPAAWRLRSPLQLPWPALCCTQSPAHHLTQASALAP